MCQLLHEIQWWLGNQKNRTRVTLPTKLSKHVVSDSSPVPPRLMLRRICGSRPPSAMMAIVLICRTAQHNPC